MRATFVRKEPEAKNIYTFYFRPEKPVRYIAGQFTELYLPHAGKDKRSDKRFFTLSSSPHEELLTITTNFTSPNGSTFKSELANLKKGQPVNLASPMGDFVLPKDPTIPLIFVAGGIGCTPFHSIVSWLDNQNEKRDITLLYSAKTLDKVAFGSTFKKLGKNFKIILQNAPENWRGPTGKFSADLIQELAEITPEHYIYVSGPEPMVETISKDLKKAGINKRHTYTDFFPGYIY